MDEELKDKATQSTETISTEPAVAPDPIAQAKAEAAEAKGQIAKLETQLQSMRANLGQRLDLEAELARLRRGVNRSLEYQNVLAKRLTALDPDAATDVQELQQRHAQADNADSASSQAAELYTDLGEEIADAFGLDFSTEVGQREAGELVRSKPELKEVQDAIVRAYDQQSGWRPDALPLLRQALKTAKHLRRSTQQTKHEAAVAKARKEAEDTAHEKLVKAGVFGTAAPGQAAASGGGDDIEAILSKPIPKNATRDELARINAALDKHMRQRS